MKRYSEDQIERIFDLIDEIELILTIPQYVEDEEDSEGQSESKDLSRYDDLFPF